MEQARNITESLVRAHPTFPEYRKALSSIYYNLDLLQGGGQLRLLLQKSVQEDLKLSESQVQKVKQLWEKRGESFRGQRDLDLEEWHKKFSDLATQEKALEELLQPEQVQRLQQIVLQQRGVRAFGEPEVARGLELTAEQKEKIRGILDEAWKVRMKPMGPNVPRSEWARRWEDNWKNARRKVLNQLTAEQKERWQEMTGEAFKGELRPVGPVGPGAYGHWPDDRRRDKP
jgi:hypothetical protein